MAARMADHPLRFVLLGLLWIAFLTWAGFLVVKESRYSLVRNFRHYELGRSIRYDERRQAYFGAGWAPPEPTHRWSDGQEAHLLFRLDRTTVAADSLQLFVHALFTRGEQPVTFVLNGHTIGSRRFPGAEQKFCLGFPTVYLAADEVNDLTLLLPEGRPIPGQDPRDLGVALREFRIGERCLPE